MTLDLLTQIYALVPGLMLVMARFGALFVSSPVLGGPYTTNRAKAIITAAVAMIVLPAAGLPTVPVDARFLLLVALEVATGLCFGLILSLFTAGVQMAGELINRFAGFTAAENFDPEADIGAGPVADLLYLGSLALLLGLDLHHHVIAALARSYQVLPVGGFDPGPALAVSLADASRHMWDAACALSFPILAAIMAITVAEGVITRAIPQINVLHISFALKIVVSLMVLIAALPAVVAFTGALLQAMLAAGWGALRAMG